MMNRSLFLLSRLVLTLALALAGTLPAASAPAGTADLASSPASAWVKTKQTAVRLIAAADAVGTADTVPLGLEFRLDKGWHIYWRTPGDAGYPPRVNWNGSENLAGATIRWPVPERFSVLNLETVGYEDSVVLPMTARLAQPGQPLRLRATVDYLTCKDICIPYTAKLALDLPAGKPSASPFAHVISRFDSRVPGDGAAHGVTIRQVTVQRAGKTATLRVRASSLSPFARPDVFVEGPPELVFGKPSVTLSDMGREATASLDIQGLTRFKGALDETPLTVTLADGLRSAERTLTPIAASAAPAGGGAADVSLILILGLALLGGLILNLMPCVLPVLSIKLLGVISHGGGMTRAVRQSFLASAAGIVFSFLVLAGALVGIKAVGGVIAWGIQFQQAWFLVAMALIVTLFACNLWGFFEIRLPAAFAGLGGGAGEAKGRAGSFLTGAFATLLATPCSAPFLGTAVAFALARGTTEILLVFTALGIGLALPYLLVAAFPGLATRLPKPGNWMIWLRRFLGFALAATAGWLVSVLVVTVGVQNASIIGGILVAIAATLAARSRFRGRLRPIATMAAVALAGIAFIVPGALGGKPDATDLTALSRIWRPFDEASIPGLVNQGRTVFVDVTAEWCVTCKVNKTFVLERDAVVKRLTAPGVVAMEADWTRPDAAITRYLTRFGRYGVPFNVVYGPGAPQGIVLPELLTRAAVEDALDRAAGTTN